MSKELIEQLRDLANCRHDDLSICYEAADRIEQLEIERDQLREQVKILWSAIEYLGATKSCQGLADALASTEPKE